MKATQAFATGLLLTWMCQTLMAAQPPGIDRPTPPPCCADGQCFASPASFGYYDTRWRRWPLDCGQPLVSGKKLTAAPAELQREAPPFERPPAEHEDRRAPAPTTPAAEQPTGTTSAPAGTAPHTQGGPVPPQGQQPSGPSGSQPGAAPGYPPPVPPQTAPMTPPGAPGAPSGTETPLFKNIPADSPLNRSGPTSDVDPPPSLPFGPQLMPPQYPVRETRQPAPLPLQVASPAYSVKQAQALSDDPPPGPPISLASWEN